MPALTPGMMRKRMPAAASASASSPPRPNTSGSPPFSRTTRLPSRARRIRRSLIRSCGVRRPPARLPTGSSRALEASARISGETSASCSTTSASARARAACRVSRPGSPGPAPTSQTVPGSTVMPAIRWRAAAHRCAPLRRAPSRRHAARWSRSRARRSAHSGPYWSASRARMRAARPGLAPPVETVSSRSPRRTSATLWKSHSSGRSSTFTSTRSERARAASSAARSSGSPAIQRARNSARSAGSGSQRRNAWPAVDRSSGWSENSATRSAPPARSAK